MNAAIGNSTRIGAAIRPTDQAKATSRKNKPSASPTHGIQPVMKCQRCPGVRSRLKGENSAAAWRRQICMAP